MKKSADESFDTPGKQITIDYEVSGDEIIRVLRSGERSHRLAAPLADGLEELVTSDPKRAWWLSRLRSRRDIAERPSNRTVLKVVDLFSGCGGLSFGLKEAAAQLGVDLDFRLAADMDEAAAEVYQRNLCPKFFLHGNVDTAVDYRLVFRGEKASLAYPPELEHPLLQALGEVDIVVGGPPCRGHSNLNNRTRRSDDRNTLYLTVPAIGIALSARIIIIENVQAVLNSKPNVVAQARQILTSNGYGVEEVVLEATGYGVAQTRKRHFMIAIRDRANEDLGVGRLLQTIKSDDFLSVKDAIGDLEIPSRASAFDAPATISDENQRRIDFLFDHDLYELPNEERPDCHKDGHTYPSVYGRLHPDAPAGTITGGFLSPGRGRFIHYSQRRGLTPHEGARIQGFPDFYDFKKPDGSALDNKSHTRLIGDAVPPPISAAVALAALIAAAPP